MVGRVRCVPVVVIAGGLGTLVRMGFIGSATADCSLAGTLRSAECLALGHETVSG
jgi:hypothetical protein